VPFTIFLQTEQNKIWQFFYELSWKETFIYFYNTVRPMNCMYYLKCSVNIFITHIILTAVEDPWEKSQQSREYYYYYHHHRHHHHYVFKGVKVSCRGKN